MSNNTEGLKRYREGLQNGTIEKAVPLDPFEKLATNPSSLRLSINAKCYDCVGRQKKEIELCTMTTCPLYNVRPLPKRKK